jgi:hypothetical protein
MADPTFEYAVDTQSRLITIRLFGREPSACYAEQIIEVYRSVRWVWRYNRLIDQRKFRGMIVVDDLKQMSAVWKSLTAGQMERPRVAFLTRDPLDHARIVANADLFPGQTRRAFTSVAEAMAWVKVHEAVL